MQAIEHRSQVLNVLKMGEYLEVAHVLDQPGREAPPSMRCADPKVINRQLAWRPLKFVELVGNESAQDCLACQRRESVDVLLHKKALHKDVTRSATA